MDRPGNRVVVARRMNKLPPV
eukprot:COSAG02_NODE_73083_length_176_cov_383.701299_1_plen_20_part_10